VPHTVAPPPINGEAASGRWSPAEPEIATPERVASPPGARTSEPALPPAAAARTAAAGPLRVAVALVLALVAVATLATFRLLLSGDERLTFGSASQALLAAGLVAAFVLFLKRGSSEAGALTALGLAALALVIAGLALAETHRIDMGGAAMTAEAGDAGREAGGETRAATSGEAGNDATAGARDETAAAGGEHESREAASGEAEREAAGATPASGEAEREAAAATPALGEAEREAAATTPQHGARPAATPASGEPVPETHTTPASGEAVPEAHTRPEAGATPGEAPAATPEAGAVPEAAAPAGAADPVAFIRDYYAALDARRFDEAWASLSPAVRTAFGDFRRWRDGYGRTISSTPKDFEVDGSTVTHVLVARDRGCPARTFSVMWRLERVSEAWRVAALSAKALDDITC
jgi:hypothetical protein